MIPPEPETVDPLEGEPLRFLVGPTASGKSELALLVAERVGAEILSLDSMAVYRGMDVGTAKPGRADLARVPHHLIDLVDPPEPYSVRRYLADARAALTGVRGRGRRALFAGGTALYLKVLCDGLFEGPEADPDLRAHLQARARAEGTEALHRELEAIDPAAAGRIHPHDEKRILRGLEVHAQTGRPLSDWLGQWEGGSGRPRRIAGLALPTAELDRRIPARTRAMFAAGWPEEARAIRDGPGFGPTSRQALGYQDALRCSDGEIALEECIERVALRTRQFARRQRTWFRRFPEIVWIPAPTESDPAATEEAVDGVVNALGW